MPLYFIDRMITSDNIGEMFLHSGKYPIFITVFGYVGTGPRRLGRKLL